MGISEHWVNQPVSPGECSRAALISPARLPSLLSCDTRLSPVNRLVSGETQSFRLPNEGEHFSRLSVERERGVGVINPRNNGEFLLIFGVRLSSFKIGDAKSWFGLPSAWNEWHSSEVGVTEPGRKNVSNPSTRSCDRASGTSGALTRGRVGARVLVRLGRPDL